jgi:hypothetical protein
MEFKHNRPKNDTNLGGWKPTMLHNGIDVLVNYKNARKFGYYESSSDRRTLARRVELPEWMNDQLSKLPLLPAIQAGRIRIPAEHSKERQGHIFWNPRQHGMDRPAVGVDQEIFDDWVSAAACQELVFVVYRFGKQELERWRISKQQFVTSSKRVQTSATFVAQQMISVTHLEVGGETSASSEFLNNPFSKL